MKLANIRHGLISLLLVLFSANSYGQIGYGPEIGAGLSTIRFAPATYPILYTSASRTAIFSGKIGGLIDVPLSRHVYFQSGIYVCQKGAERSFSFYDNATTNESVQQTLHFTCLELPLVVVVKTSEQGYGRFIAGLGAAPAYMVAGSYKMENKGANTSGPFDINSSGKLSPDKEFHAFDIGVLLTAGYEFPGSVFVRAYFESGVNNLSSNTEITKNRMFGISAGYLMGKDRNIKKKKGDLIDITPD